MIAAELANRRKYENRFSKIDSSIEPSISQQESADLLNVSHSSVKRATKVKTEGAEELKQAVQDGEVKVSVAADLEIICGEIPL